MLHHAEGGRDVTGRHYALHENTSDKARVPGAWKGWLLGLLRERAPRAVAWPGFLPLRMHQDDRKKYHDRD